MDSCATLLAAAACCVAHGLYALLRFRKNSLFAANVIIVDMSAACERASFRQRRLCIAGKSRLVSVRQHEGDVAKVVFRTRDTVARLPPPHLLALVEPRRWFVQLQQEHKNNPFSPQSSSQRAEDAHSSACARISYRNSIARILHLRTSLCIFR